MAHTIERRPYGPESNPEERQAIHDRVYMYAPNIIYWDEVPVMSIWQVEQFGEKVDALLADISEFYILVDLTDSKPPGASIRAALRGVLAPLKNRGLRSVAAFTEKNFIINVAAKFVLGGSGLPFSVHRNRSDALAAITGG